MSFRTFLSVILCLFPTSLLANWQLVGKADYNWGPFHVYTVSLYSENGEYQAHQMPIMLSFDYAKPVEGKNFAITLIKEMTPLRIDSNKTEKWLKELQETLPDCSPSDRLNYIALGDTGYFVLNDKVLEHQFDAEFNRAFMDLWLSGKTAFGTLKEPLIGKTKVNTTTIAPKKIEIDPTQENEDSPQIPPTYELEQDKQTGT